MMLFRLLIPVTCFVSLVGCAYSVSEQGTIGQLDRVDPELKDIKVDSGLEKAMASYQHFLNETPESALTPEAIRRLADLKVEKEYGTLGVEGGGEKNRKAAAAAPVISETESVEEDKQVTRADNIASISESQKSFEARATQQGKVKKGTKYSASVPGEQKGATPEEVGAREAIALYNKLLTKYPLYERNDQVLYQLSRAHEEIGEVDQAMNIMTRLIKQYPGSRYLDEIFFRRGEYYFTRKKFLDAEESYQAVLKYGVGTVYYESALYKLGWSFYKQDLYEEALKQFFTLLDYKVSIGYDFDQKDNKLEKKRIDDTFRVISLSFSNLGGSEPIQEYFAQHGKKKYEDKVYSHLAEFFFDKRRYSDAAKTYDAFIQRNPYHKVSPLFSMRTIEIYQKGNFPKLVIEAKKNFASTYGLKSKYWTLHNKKEYPEAIGFLKKNIIDLANHYHAVFQEPRFRKNRPESFTEAAHWYREFLSSFPREKESSGINFQLSELLLENKNFSLAAIEFEKTAYDYPLHEKSEKAAYAAVFAHRENLNSAPPAQKNSIKRSVIRSSLRLVDTYPKHEKATIVLSAAVDDLYEMKDYVLAIKSGRMLVTNYPQSSRKIKRNAWIVISHSSFELQKFEDAEAGYSEVLSLTDGTDKDRVKFQDNLAISIYRQGELAKAREDYKTAVKHFLRIAQSAPSSKIRPTAEYDAAAVLIQVMDLEQAAVVLLDFRKNYPGHKLQHDITKKIAYVYKESGKNKLAAKEYERIFTESKDDVVKREALLSAAELYEKAEDTDSALVIYKRFVKYYPKPVEFALETYYKIALVYKSRKDMSSYHNTLDHIIRTDQRAGKERTDRTRYLAAQSSLVMVEPDFEKYSELKLVAPFKRSLTKKKNMMKALVDRFNKLVDYKVADVTAASTYYIAEIYYNFNRSLMTSERPKKLSELELEEYNLMLEDQAYPFEEKTIAVHEKNMELLGIGVYSSWIDRSIEKLAVLLPARYGKPEDAVAFISEIDSYVYDVPVLKTSKPKEAPTKSAQDEKQTGEKSNNKTTEQSDQPVTENIKQTSPSTGKGDTGSPGGSEKTDVNSQDTAVNDKPVKDDLKQDRPVAGQSEPESPEIAGGNSSTPAGIKLPEHESNNENSATPGEQ